MGGERAEDRPQGERDRRHDLRDLELHHEVDVVGGDQPSLDEGPVLVVFSSATLRITSIRMVLAT